MSHRYRGVGAACIDLDENPEGTNDGFIDSTSNCGAIALAQRIAGAIVLQSCEAQR